MSTYRAQQTVMISGSHSGEEIELQQVVTFRVLPGYPETRMTPAEPMSVEIDSIRYFEDATREVKLPAFDDEFEQSEGFKDWLLGEANEQALAAADEAADAKREERV